MDDDGSSHYGGSVAGGNDSLQNSVIGGDFSFASGDDETNDLLRGIFGDDYVHEFSLQNQLSQAQHAVDRPQESRTQGENEDQRLVQEGGSFLPNHTRFGEPQGPRLNADLHEATSTLNFGHQVHQGRNNLAHLMQQQYHQNQTVAQSYHQVGRGISQDSHHMVGGDGAVDHQQHRNSDHHQDELSRQHASANSQQYLHDQMMARQMIQKRMAQHQQQLMMMHLPPQETLYDHKIPPSSVPKHQLSSDAVSSIVEVVNNDSSPLSEFEGAKRQRLDISDGQGPAQPQDPAAMSYAARNQHMPKWMNGVAAPQQRTVAPSASSVYKPPVAAYGRPVVPFTRQYKPIMREIPEHHIPTWELPLPIGVYRMARGPRRFELSLVNVKEFTITGLPTGHDKPPSSLDGLRKKIKEISKDHGVAVYERGKEGGPGRWRIPLVRLANVSCIFSYRYLIFLFHRVHTPPFLPT